MIEARNTARREKNFALRLDHPSALTIYDDKTKVVFIIDDSCRKSGMSVNERTVT